MSTAWQNVARSVTGFVNRAITGIAHWGDANVMWSDAGYTWGDVGIAYVNQPKSVNTVRSFLPFAAWLFWFTVESDAITPTQWNYETKD